MGRVPTHVLVPLDGSPLADAALAHALAVHDCRVTVLNVVTPLDEGMSEGGVVGLDDERREAAEAHAEAVLSAARERAEGADRTVEAVVEAGDPAETILEYVEGHDVDHVVLGSHSESTNALARRLLGTVATAVVGDAPVPVTVIR